MLAAPAVERRILRRCASNPRKETGRLQRSRLVAGCGDKQRGDLLLRQIEMIGRGIHGKPRRPRGSKCSAVARELPSRPRYSKAASA